MITSSFGHLQDRSSLDRMEEDLRPVSPEEFSSMFRMVIVATGIYAVIMKLFV